MTQGGEALGRDETGRVVFVPYALAGEEVIVEIVEEKNKYARARLIEVVTPSPARVTPRCPHFGPSAQSLPGNDRKNRGCGGCQWQHIAYDAQLKYKTEIVREQFTHIGKLPDAPVRETIGMPDPWHYRNNVQFQMDSESRLCFRALDSHDLVQIKECHILHPLLDELFRALDFESDEYAGVALRAGTQTKQKMIILAGRDRSTPEISVDEAVSIVYQTPQGETVSLIGKEALHEDLGGRTFRVSPQSFFQVNTVMAEKLVDHVERYLDPQPDDTLLDAYGGVGTFGLLVAPRVTRVICVEENKNAVDDARANAVDLPNVESHCGAAEAVLPNLKTKIDLAVADPPRAGLALPALDALVAHAPRTFVYVSCDPATLARDARRLIDRGYHLIETQPIDMFPQTFHIETISLFVQG